MGSIEIKGGVLKAVEEGKARIRLATLFRVDKDNDVIEHGFFPTAPPLVVSIQPYHNHQTPSLGHAKVWEDSAKGEVIAEFEFNDSYAAQEQWKVLRWDYEHGAIQEFSWAFRPKPGAARQGNFEGHSVRFLSKAADGGYGVDLLECGPVLRGASVNSGTIAVRSAGPGIGPGHPDYAKIELMFKRNQLAILRQKIADQQEIRELFAKFMAREREMQQ